MSLSTTSQYLDYTPTLHDMVVFPMRNATFVVGQVLREAPFAVGNSKPMWRVFLTSQPFTELTADGFW